VAVIGGGGWVRQIRQKLLYTSDNNIDTSKGVQGAISWTRTSIFRRISAR